MQPSASDRSGYLSTDTICALATPVGGAIAVVRVSGPRTFEAMEALGAQSRSEKWEPRRLYRVVLKNGEGVKLDDVLWTGFRAPSSYTGEDSAEIHAHGGSIGVGRILEALQTLGVRSALPGEFSFRAVRNGKMELGQAEAVADLISAASEAAADLALEKLGGSQSSWMKDVAEQIRQIATYAEAGVDFSDQDLEEDSLEALRSKLDSPILGLETLERTFERGLRIQDGVRAAFVGLPNAGKSSFFNVLLGEDRSIVSEIEGTTRDIVRERLVLRGKRGSVALRLEDTAGLRASQDQVEQIGVERTRQAARQADVILLLWDGSREGAAAEEAFEALQAIWESLGRPKEKTLGIVTKADLGRESSDWLGRLGVLWVGPTSARSGEGVHEAAQRIADFAETWGSRKPGEILLTRRDHRESVLAALEHLRRARRAPGVELLASDLRQALLSLAPLIGETPPDDILGRIFSQFCIGK